MTSDNFKPASTPGGLRVRTFAGSESEITLLANALHAGELVAIPTETVYGLAANALDAAACGKIFEVKGRPLIDPLIVHVAGVEQAQELAVVDERARLLMQRYWPGPLTLVLPRRAHVPPIVTAGLDTVAVRSPQHPLARRLIEAAGLPLAAPSANPFGYISPTTAQHVADSLGSRIDYILDGGPCSVGVESTIVDVSTGGAARLLRPGKISREELEATLGEPVEVKLSAAPGVAAEAPGMLDRHYSPLTPLDLFEEHPRPVAGEEREAFVFFRRPPAGTAPSGFDCFWMTEDGDPAEAARRVFAILRQLDQGGYKRIQFQMAPAAGIGVAINDRLRRAAARGEC